MGSNTHAAAVAVLATSALLLSACGGGDEDVASTSTMPTVAAIVDPAEAGGTEVTPRTNGARNTALPDLPVVRVASNDTVALQELAPPGKPMLLWFWAPHCTFCRAEAPALLAFERANRDRISVLGLGAQDDLDQAVDFLSDTGTDNVEMVWDSTGKSWLHFKVTNQPTVVLVDADGKVTEKWFRDFDADAILKAAGLAAASRG